MSLTVRALSIADDDELKKILSSLEWIKTSDDPINAVAMCARGVTSSWTQSGVTPSAFNSLAGRANCTPLAFRASVTSFLDLREFVFRNKVERSHLEETLLAVGFAEELSKAIAETAYIIPSPKPMISTRSSISRFPPFKSLRARTEITIGKMALHNCAEVAVQLRFVIGDVERSVIVDASMLKRLTAELERVMSNAYKLERLSIK